MERGSSIYRADVKLTECINMKERTYFQQHDLMLFCLFVFHRYEAHPERCCEFPVRRGD